MGLLGAIAGLPLAPVRGVIGLARVVSEEAERQLSGPAAIRRQIEAIAESRDAGLLSGEEAARLEHEAVQRLLWQPGTGVEDTRGQF
jgi:hypothetical protein